MSFFSGIASAEHTVLLWFEKEWATLEKDAPAIEAYADKAFTYSSNVLKIVLAQVEPGGEAAKIIGEALKDISTVSAVVYDAGASPTVAGLITDISTNLGGLLTAGHIANAKTVGTVTKVVNTIASIASAFLTIAPAVAAAV